MDEVMLMLFQVAIGKRAPFHDCYNDIQVMASITSNKLPKKPKGVVGRAEHLELLWNCCCECWHHSPADRPTMAEMRKRLSVSWR
jgi:hypothetical protein